MSFRAEAADKPYLKEIVALYEKVMALAETPLSHDYGIPGSGETRYAGDDMQTVIDAFGEIFSVNAEELGALRETLETEGFDFLQLPALEADEPGSIAQGDDAPSLLYIISRPFFRAIAGAVDAEGITWTEGRCPVCNAVPALSVIEPNTMRRYHCTFCGTSGHYRRIGCPNCLSEDAANTDILASEDFEGTRLDVCRNCKTYVKSIDAETLGEFTLVELDLLSLPLDIVAQKRGFFRRSPNIVGITRVG